MGLPQSRQTLLAMRLAAWQPRLGQFIQCVMVASSYIRQVAAA